MKLFPNLFITVGLCLFLSFQATAQGQKAQKATIKLPTVSCEQCKATIENSVWKQVEGVQFIEVKVKQKYAKVTFLPDRISLDNLRLYIADLGYQADEEAPDPEAMKLLPKVCKEHLMTAPAPVKKTVSDTLKMVPKKG
jgi:periplasmic mercuric ion binding protein